MAAVVTRQRIIFCLSLHLREVATTAAFLSRFDALTESRRHYKGTRRRQAELFPQRLKLPENRGYVPVLSPNQITTILREHEASVDNNAKGSSPVSSFDSNQLASNSPIEDRRAVGWLTQTGAQLFGVYDGHGGSACAQAISERLLEYIAVSTLPTELLEQYARQMRTDQPLQILTQHHFREAYASDDLTHIYFQSLQRYVTEMLSFSGDDTNVSESIVDQLNSAFHRLDTDISQEAMPISGAVDPDLVEIALSGACSCVAHVKGNILNVANVGDCRAVVGHLDPDGTWRAIPMTTDQNVDNEVEVSRLRNSHPKSESGTIVKNDRLLGQLIPLRAFGDVRFKWSVSDLKSLAAAVGGNSIPNYIPAYYLTPPYLIAQPDVTRHELRHSDRFLVIASDGLWEAMSNKEVIDIVGDHLLGKESRDRAMSNVYHGLTFGEIANLLNERTRGLKHLSTDDNGATHLIRHALGFEHRKVSEMLTFPPAMARHYRDDITITIVYFDEEYLKQNGSD
jgi:pyruvate dehydrogenase phosphatase